MITNFIIQHHLENSIVGKLYFEKAAPLVSRYKRHSHNMKMQKLIKAYGLPCLSTIYAICKKHNSNVWLEYGSMLGAYREHGFIPFDYDIDLGMYADEFTPELQREFFDAGFSIRRIFYQVRNLDENTKFITEYTLCYKGLLIDIFLNFRENGFRTAYGYEEHLGVEKMERNIYGAQIFKIKDSPIDEINFLGVKFGIPQNTEECLKFYYGDKFMTPIEGYKRPTDDLNMPYEEAFGEMYGAW